MPNIKQQKKRVRVAARQRLENLRYRSTVKTLTRRLEEAVAEGDAAAVADRRRQLEHWLDRAAVRGAIHRNKAARRKAQATRLAAAAVPAAATPPPEAEAPAEETPPAAEAPKRRRGRRAKSDA